MLFFRHILTYDGHKLPYTVLDFSNLYRHMAVTPEVVMDTGVLAQLSLNCGPSRSSLLGIHLLKCATEYVLAGQTGQWLLNSLLESERDYNATNERRKGKNLPPLS